METINKPQALPTQSRDDTSQKYSHRTLGLARRLASVLLIVVVFTTAFGAASWRLDKAPDIFSDEIVYTRVSLRTAVEGALVWDSGKTFVVHPPLYFMLAGAFYGLTGDPSTPMYAPGDIFAEVYHMRLFNTILAGLTAVILFWLGKRLRGGWLGILLAGLFILDPFGLRINRRAMLETLAAFFALGGMALLLAGQENEPRAIPRAIWAGLLMGAALLAKELTFTAPLVVVVFGMWEIARWFRYVSKANIQTLLSPFVSVGIAVLTYSIYPIWMLTTGGWERFASVKILSLQRLFGLVQLSGWNRPGLSLFEMLQQRLTDYGSTYLILALGGAATLWIFLFGKEQRAGRLLAAWGLMLYPFYAFVALFGSGNDQFFYFLLMPAIVLFGYALFVPLGDSHQWLKSLLRASRVRVAARLIAALVLIAVLSYNITRWWTAYGVGIDNGYYQLAEYVKANLPENEPINASGDSIKFHYFFPDYLTTVASTPEEAQKSGVQYFALAPKDVQGRYGRITPELASWIAANGELLFTTHGNSYGEIDLYRIGAATPPARPLSSVEAMPFIPAQGGAVDGLVVGLLLWLGSAGGLASWLWRSARLEQKPQPSGEVKQSTEMITTMRPVKRGS